MKEYKDIDSYIADFPVEVQAKLSKLRTEISRLVPEATEAIKYGIPTFVLDGKNLIHFGGYNDHIGLYPTPDVLDHFEAELEPYRSGKGTARIPLDQELPLKLVAKLVEARVQQIRGK